MKKLTVVKILKVVDKYFFPRDTEFKHKSLREKETQNAKVYKWKHEEKKLRPHIIPEWTDIGLRAHIANRHIFNFGF